MKSLQGFFPFDDAKVRTFFLACKCFFYKLIPILIYVNAGVNFFAGTRVFVICMLQNLHLTSYRPYLGHRPSA